MNNLYFNNPSKTDLTWLLDRFSKAAGMDAVVWRDQRIDYALLLRFVEDCRSDMRRAGVTSGDCVAISADYSPKSIAMFLAAATMNCIVVPFSRGVVNLQLRLVIAEVDYLVSIDTEDFCDIQQLEQHRSHPLLQQLRSAGSAGIILFSSGTTDEPKAVLHDLKRLLRKRNNPGRCYRTVSFLLFDHIGGLNTLFYSLANHGCLIVPEARTLQGICDVMARHQAELLPTTPSFLNLMLAGQVTSNFDLHTWVLGTYGTEVMSESTLAGLVESFPKVTFKQTYGLTELGIMSSRSRSSDSLYLEFGGKGYETRVVSNRLQIRTKNRMLGYLNAPSPFDQDGWFDTHDVVEKEHSYIRIQGRNSDVINVGGLKVHPQQIEEVIASLDGVVDVTVFGQTHLLLGQTVVARVQVETSQSRSALTRLVRNHCIGRLEPYMIPSKVIVSTESAMGDRLKKVRR